MFCPTVADRGYGLSSGKALPGGNYANYANYVTMTHTPRYYEYYMDAALGATGGRRRQGSSRQSFGG
jgi:hypothetical protein